jgi:hypothetical protein
LGNFAKKCGFKLTLTSDRRGWYQRKRRRKELDIRNQKERVMGYIEGLFIVAVATALSVWINDKFDIGGDYVEITPEA